MSLVNSFLSWLLISSMLSPHVLMQGLMLFDTFIRDLADGMERKHLAWQGAAALGWYREVQGTASVEFFKACLGSQV